MNIANKHSNKLYFDELEIYLKNKILISNN